MRPWRAAGLAVAVAAGTLAVLILLLEFLAPDVSYRVRDAAAEVASGARWGTYRIALGARTGSNYRIGAALNRHLRAAAGYALELVETTSPGNADSLRQPSAAVDLAMILSTDDEAVRAEGVYGLAALELQHFFVIVGNGNPAKDFRDLVGPVNPGVRDAGDPPTLGERVLDYYGMIAPGPGETPPAVRVVRPQQGNLEDLESGHSLATTRTQFLRSDLIERMLQTGGYRLLPIRDHEALATLLPGASASFIPTGLYGPGRRIPSEPIPTIAARQLLVARADVPGRVVRDILEVVYSPRFQRDVQYALTETSGRDVGGLALHPAADFFYRRHDAVTADRLGRVSFVASAVAGLFALAQFVSRSKREEPRRRRRQLLAGEFARLETIRQRIEASSDPDAATGALREADDLLLAAERDAALGVLDAEAMQALRSVHTLSSRLAERRSRSSISGHAGLVQEARPGSTSGSGNHGG